MTKPSSPPRLALRLLERIVERDDEFGAAGDLEERYAFWEQEQGAGRARLDCWKQALASLPGYLGNQLYWSHQMFKNYLKIAFRTLWKHKGYSFINVAGLALGMACSLFILLWVQDELSFDRFHANAKTIYRLEAEEHYSQGKLHSIITTDPLGPALKAEIPEIRETARFYLSKKSHLLRQGDKVFFENRIGHADPSFLKMFSFPAIQGNSETALSGPASIVLTEDLAKKYFGKDNPVGRTLTLDNQYPIVVTAVLKNVPANSSLQFDALLPVEFLNNLGNPLGRWDHVYITTFVQIHEKSPGAIMETKPASLGSGKTRPVEQKITDLVRRKRPENLVASNFTLNPLVDLRLFGYSGFDRNDQAVKTISLFSAIALFVLLIACINFMNLATARSANRAKEVGLRKVVGAFRKSIAGQFYGESILTALLAGLGAVTLVAVCLPAFNALSGKYLILSSLFNPKFILGIAAVTLITGFIAGSYPALFLSSFQPVKVLKGRMAGGARSASFRKILVVVQFGLSILLLIGMAIATRQIDYMRNKKLGYDKEQLVYLPLRGETGKSFAALKERLLRDPKIQGVTGTYQTPAVVDNITIGLDWEGKDPNQEPVIRFEYVDYDYPETMKIGMAAGRTFSRQFPTDESNAVLINEAVAKLLGLDAGAAVGKRFRFMDVECSIIGVMKDFHFQSVRQSIEPLVVSLGFGELTRYAVVRFRAADIRSSLGAVEAAWREINSAYPFEYRFLDQDFDRMYRTDEQTGKILKIFSFLAMVIACLGLFGLASFTAEQRTKEIGVRKVLGASAPGIVVLLSKEFAKWVLIANALAWPVAFFIMRGWLQQFAYKTNIAWWLFAAAGAGALVVAMLTVSFQALRAARTNPVRALKYE